MAGPGGGRNGGGFSGGSGGFSGGGGYRGGRGPRFYGGFYRPFGFFGGGCLGGLMSIILAPVIMIVFAAVLLISSLGTVITSIGNGGTVVYNEQSFQAYANEEYYEHFSNTGSAESGILIVFLTNEDYDNYTCIAWVGDNISTRVNEMFGNEYTAFGKAILSSVNTEYYEYSLSSNLAMAMNKITDSVTALGLSSSFIKEPNFSTRPASKLVNDSSLSISSDTVNISLEGFTEATGIPIVLTVDEMEDVFGKTIFTSEFVMSIFAILLIGVAIFIIVRNIIRSKKANNGRNNNPFGGNSQGGNSNIFDGNPF